MITFFALAATLMAAAPEDWQLMPTGNADKLYVDADSVSTVDGHQEFTVRIELADTPGQLFMRVAMDCEAVTSEGLTLRAVSASGQVLHDETFPKDKRPQFTSDKGKSDPMYLLVCKG